MEKRYAKLFDRVKAAVIDSLFIMASIYVITSIFSQFENIPVYVKIIVSAFVFVLYDPIFTSCWGATIGHSQSGIALRSEDNLDENITFPIAIIRFIVKVFLGWISLLTITGNEKKKAIHDYVAKSVVIIVDQ